MEKIKNHSGNQNFRSMLGQKNVYKQTSGMKMTETEKNEAVKTYTCSMHPEVTSDKPGKCPKCGMELIEKK